MKIRGERNLCAKRVDSPMFNCFFSFLFYLGTRTRDKSFDMTIKKKHRYIIKYWEKKYGKKYFLQFPCLRRQVNDAFFMPRELELRPKSDKLKKNTKKNFC